MRQAWRSGNASRSRRRTTHVLDLRARRPDDFAGAYEPVDAGPDVCAFRRGEGVLVVVPLRPRAQKGSVAATEGWHDLLPELPVGLYARPS